MNWLGIRCALNKAEIAAFIIDTNPELANREKLAELSGILSLESVSLISPETDRYQPCPITLYRQRCGGFLEFNKRLVDSLVRPARRRIRRFHQYIGVTLRDEENNPNGLCRFPSSRRALR